MTSTIVDDNDDDALDKSESLTDEREKEEKKGSAKLSET